MWVFVLHCISFGASRLWESSLCLLASYILTVKQVFDDGELLKIHLRAIFMLWHVKPNIKRFPTEQVPSHRVAIWSYMSLLKQIAFHILPEACVARYELMQGKFTLTRVLADGRRVNGHQEQSHTLATQPLALLLSSATCLRVLCFKAGSQSA